MHGADTSFILALALATGVLAQSVARHLRIPGIVLLLGVGVGLGPDGLGWILPRSLGAGLSGVVDFAVAIILFEGGLNLDISRLRRAQRAIRRLVTWGAGVSFIGGTLAARIVLDWDWSLAFMFGSLVVVTGPTVIGPMVSEWRLKKRPATVLEAEGVLIDPIGALLAILVLELVVAPDPGAGALTGARALGLRLSMGIGLGVAGGFLVARALGQRKVVPEGHRNIFVLAAVLFLYTACEHVASHSGVLAVTLAGVVVGNFGSNVERDLREFKDQLTMLLIGLLFVMLAADVRAEQVRELGLRGVAVVAVLIVVVRPLGVWISTAGSDLSRNERLFISWIAPRGIVAAAIASLVASALESGELGGGAELRALVFLTIAGTVVLAGVTGRRVGDMLGVRLAERDTVAILGAKTLGLMLARLLRAGNTPVILLDSNPQSARHAEEAGFSTVFGNALQERMLQRARFESVKTAVALTANQTLNGVFVSRARELFGVPDRLVSASQLDGGLTAELIERHEAAIVFDGLHDLERWEIRMRRGSTSLEPFVFAPRPEPESPETEGEGASGTTTGEITDVSQLRTNERFLILAVFRDGRSMPMRRKLEPVPGDVAAILIHTPDRAEAIEALADLGWSPAEIEPESAAEKIVKIGEE